jgi:hypothetical protein
MRFFIGCVILTLATLSAEAAGQFDFAGTLRTTLENVILQDHQAFADASLGITEPINNLCENPSSEHLEAVRTSFEGLVLNWSKIEIYRFGPAREANRFEKLFYWPDRRGRALRQVQNVLDSQDPTALSVEKLAKKSVAVQGLLALEFALFGNDAVTLVTGNSYRCNYAKAIAGVIAMNAHLLFNSWQGEAGYAAELMNAGQENFFYRSHGEAVQELIKAAVEQLKIVGDLKIAASIGTTTSKAKPKRAPFWRSDLTLATLKVNVNSVEKLLDSGISDLVTKKHSKVPKSFKFALNQVKAALATTDSKWIDTVMSDRGHKVLYRSHTLLAGATQIIQVYYPRALGLVLGFNTLDGD